MNKITPIALLSLLLVFTLKGFSQELTQQQSIDTLNAKVEGLESDVKILKKIKFSGLLQPQFQMSDTIGSPSFSGAEFKGYDNRFTIRRARLKAAYAGDNTNIVLQLDLRENAVFVKEAYGSFSEPWMKTFTISAGVMNRPIGYEVEASSSTMEYPERSRITQTLFPDECDLGAKLTIQAPKTSALNFMKLDIGLYDGNAIAAETDNYKDFIGHYSLKRSFLNENLTVGAGVSYYNGGWANQSGKVYNFEKSTGYALDANYKKLDKVKREYYGIDAQATFSSAVGITTIRGEYLWGQQPGTQKSSISPKGLVTETKTIVVLDTLGAPYSVTSNAINSDAYLRNFSGGYVSLIQRIMQTKHEVVVKYDWFDPNTDASGSDINGLNKTFATDLKFHTLGIGWNYYITNYLRIMAYYEMVTNETAATGFNANAGIKNPTGVTDYTKDLKDNIFTLRFNFRF
jgi:hypothetical protein